MRDLRRNRQMAGMLFNVLFNLNKFVQFETRDPFTARQASGAGCVRRGGGGEGTPVSGPHACCPCMQNASHPWTLSAPRRTTHRPAPPSAFRQEREEVGVSEWDRFARNEYMRLSMEDEAETDGAEATASAWTADALAVEL